MDKNTISQDILETQAKLESSNRYYPQVLPLVIDSADGAVINDIYGNEYIDFFAGSGVMNVGYNNREVVDAVKKQLDLLVHALDFPTPVKIDLLKEIHSSLPEELNNRVKINFSSPSGSDTNEFAFKLAVSYTKRKSFFSFEGGYHGMTTGSLSVTSFKYHKQDFPTSAIVNFFPYAYCYRCKFGKEQYDCKLECTKYMRDSLENPGSGIHKPAAIILEPVQGEGGTIVPKWEFLAEIRKIADDHGVLLIFDEIQSGFFRTGRLFAFEHSGVIPDIITASKGFGGIGLPIALCIYKEKYDKLIKGTHLGTFRGNQLSYAAGLAALKYAKNNNFKKQINDSGTYIIDQLMKLKLKYHFIGDIRGIGLMIGIEYVKDKKSKEPDSNICDMVLQKCFEKGLLVTTGGSYSNVIRFLPPLNITRDKIDQALEIFNQVNFELAREMN